MAAKYQHTVQLPEEIEQGWLTLNAQRETPETFNGFINRLIRQELELLCAHAAPTSTTRSEM